MSYIFIDTEDNSRELMRKRQSGFKKKITQICAHGTDGNWWGKDPEKFKTWLRNSHPPGSLVYAHNVQYDIGSLWGKVLPTVDMLLVGGRLIRAKIEKQHFRDTMNIFPMSLKKLGEAFGLEKGKLDEYSRDYVEMDCRIGFQAVAYLHDFCAEWNIVRPPATLGGLAVKVWRELGGNNWTCPEDWFRQGYYGGRVELFAKVVSPFAYTDINSLYPWTMLQEFPTGIQKLPDIDGLGMAEVDIIIPEDFAVAPLPWRRPEDGAILFPTGRLSGFWTTAELQYAVSRGCRIQKLKKCFGSKTGEKYYADYAREMYRRRLEAKTGPEKLVYKLLMNNLYGRLAMKGLITRTLDIEDERHGVPFGDKKLCEVTMPLTEETNTLHAAWITSLARVRLAQYLERVPPADLGYCDTDSIIFRDSGGKLPFEISTDLGEMKLEKRGKNAETFGKKIYHIDGEYKAKGVQKKNAKKFVQKGKVLEYRPYKVREAVAFFDRENAKQLSVWRKVEKEFRVKYDQKKLEGNRYFPLPIFEFAAKSSKRKTRGAKNPRKRLNRKNK